MKKETKWYRIMFLLPECGCTDLRRPPIMRISHSHLSDKANSQDTSHPIRPTHTVNVRLARKFRITLNDILRWITRCGRPIPYRTTETVPWRVSEERRGALQLPPGARAGLRPPLFFRPLSFGACIEWRAAISITNDIIHTKAYGWLVRGEVDHIFLWGKAGFLVQKKLFSRSPLVRRHEWDEFNLAPMLVRDGKINVSFSRKQNKIICNCMKPGMGKEMISNQFSELELESRKTDLTCARNATSHRATKG